MQPGCTTCKPLTGGNMETVGSVGVGRMGSTMAQNIQNAGYAMVVQDAGEEATRPLLEGGARKMEEVVEGRDGILAGIKEGHVYLDLSTCGPALVRRLEPRFRQRGAHLSQTYHQPSSSSP